MEPPAEEETPHKKCRRSNFIKLNDNIDWSDDSDNDMDYTPPKPSEMDTSGSSDSGDETSRKKRTKTQKKSRKKKNDVPVEPDVSDLSEDRACGASNSQLPSMCASQVYDEKDETESSDEGASDTDCSADEVSINRCVDMPGLYFRKLTYSETTITGKKKKHLRVYNSYQYCAFCKTKVSNFAQHVRRQHKKKDEVEKIINSDLDSKKQGQLLTLLRLQHNHMYNMQSRRKERGELFIERRTAGQISIKDIGPCPACKAWMGRDVIWRHQQSCKANPSVQLSSAALVTQSDTVAQRISPAASKKLVQEVFSKMREDEVGLLARQDPLIIGLGNQWLEKNVGNPLKRGKYTSQVMRLNATNLLHMRTVKPLENNSTWDYLKPQHFDDVATATLMTAASTMDNDEDLVKPSNAIKLGFDIKRMLNIKAALAIMDGDNDSRKDVEDFRIIMNTFWATKITKLARVILLDRQFNKETKLPHPSDLNKLNDFMAKKLRKLDLTMKTGKNFKLVAKVVAAKVTMYNRRRPGEMENMR